MARALALVAICSALLIAGTASVAAPLRPVVLQIAWDHQFQFAGYYVAQWNGYFAAEGLDVTIRSRVRPDGKMLSPVDEVSAGRADIGIGSAEILMGWDNGHDLAIVASIFQRDPMVFVSRRETGIRSAADLMGRQVGYYKGSASEAVLRAMLASVGSEWPKDLPPAGVSLDALLTGRIDALVQYNMTAPWVAEQAGVNFEYLAPSSYGLDFYGDSLFALRATVDRDPDLIVRFLRAVTKGWRAALADPNEIAERIVAELPRTYPLIGDPVAFNRWQAERVREAMIYPVVEVGNTSAERWARTHAILKRYGIVHNEFDAARAIYDPGAVREQRQDAMIRIATWGGAALTLLAILCGLWIVVLRRVVAARTGHLNDALLSLRESEGRFRTITETSPFSIVITRPDDGRILYVNRAYAEQAGKSPPELIGAFASTMWTDPADRDLFVATLKRDGQVRGMETLGRNAKGEVRDGIVRAALIAFDGAEAILSCVLDVTEQKRVDLARRRADARLSGILAISPEAIITIDADRRITLFNAGAEATFGYSAAEVLGKEIETLMPERFRGPHVAQMAQFASGQTTSRRMAERGEIACWHKGGFEFPAEAAIAKFTLDGETILAVTLHDISDRKKAEAAMIEARDLAESANIAKSQFLANMSHELRTPLNAIIGFSEIMQRRIFGPLGDARYEQYASDILDSGRHLLAVINDILDLAKVEARRTELDEGTHLIADMVRGALSLVRERAARNGLKIELELADDLPGLYADARKLKQVLVNLLSNAVKFTPHGGRITIKSWAGSDGLVLQVADTGIGIDSADIPRAFALFGQVDGGLNRKHEGTGLGLPLAKALVELHGGTLDLQSVQGEGSVVTVRLPASRLCWPERESLKSVGT